MQIHCRLRRFGVRMLRESSTSGIRAARWHSHCHRFIYTFYYNICVYCVVFSCKAVKNAFVLSHTRQWCFASVKHMYDVYQLCTIKVYLRMSHKYV